jgi:hypothetical protein
MTGPNANAGPADVANKIDGLDAGGNQLRYRIAAMLYDAKMFGLNKDYAFPEGPNASPSLEDQTATLAKLLTRKQKLADGNDYDIFDAVFTVAKWVVKQNIHINDDEVNSVNHKPVP